MRKRPRRNHSLLQHARANPGGGITTGGKPLNDSPELFKQTEPPLCFATAWLRISRSWISK